MFLDYKYSVISITQFTSFFRFLLLSTSNVRMSEGTFCRVEVHMGLAHFKILIFSDYSSMGVGLEKYS